MLILDDVVWDYPTFEAYVEGLRRQVACYPGHVVPFVAQLDALSVLTLFAIWKEGKIAKPLSRHAPYVAALFMPMFPRPCPAARPEWDLDRIATHLYTSGSTAEPKIACHTLRNHVMSARGSAALLPLNEKSVWALTLPLFHVGGLAILMRCYLAGASVLIAENLAQATHLSLVPTQLYRMVRDGVKLPAVQTILLGGAPLPALKTAWPILPTYGMTEMSSQIVTGSRVHPHAEMKLAEDGEILVRGEVLFQGYLQKDGSMVCPLTEDGFFATRDVGAWQAGEFHVVGRKDNQFISGGENIQPEEIELAIRELCGIEEAVVVPIADEEFGHRPAVFLRKLETFPRLQHALADRLPKFKIPIRAFVLPEDTGLKPNRQLLLASLEK